MGTLADIGRSNLGQSFGTMYGLVQNRRAMALEKSKQAIQANRQTAIDDRENKKLQIEQGKFDLEKRKADAEYEDLHGLHSIGNLTNSARHIKAKQYIDETAKVYSPDGRNISKFNGAKWLKEHGSSLSKKKIGWWEGTYKELKKAHDNFGKKGEEGVAENVQQTLDNNTWVLDRPLKNRADIKEAMQSASNELLRMDKTVHAAELAREAAAKKASAAEEKAKIPKSIIDPLPKIKQLVKSFGTPPGAFGEIKMLDSGERRKKVIDWIRARDGITDLTPESLALVDAEVMTSLGIELPLQNTINQARVLGSSTDQIERIIKSYIGMKDEGKTPFGKK